jgi:hypothetical protein
MWTGIFIPEWFLEKGPLEGSVFVLKSREWVNEGQ